MELAFRGGPNSALLDPQRVAQQRGFFFHCVIDFPRRGASSRPSPDSVSPFALSERATVSARVGETMLAKVTVSYYAPDALLQAHGLMLYIALEGPDAVILERMTSRHGTSTQRRFGMVKLGEAAPERFGFYPANWTGRLLSTVVIGTTAVCNANCSHRPTNKAWPWHQADP